MCLNKYFYRSLIFHKPKEKENLFQFKLQGSLIPDSKRIKAEL